MDKQRLNESIKTSKKTYEELEQELEIIENKLSGSKLIYGGMTILSGVGMVCGLGTQTPTLGLIGLGLLGLIGLTAPYYMALCYKKNKILKEMSELKEHAQEVKAR